MKKDVILFMAIFLVLSMIAGGTYAYWQWVNAENTTVVFNTVKDIDDYIYYDAGESHFIGNFQPSSTHCGGESSTASFYIKSDAPTNITAKDANGNGVLYVTLNMNVNAIDSSIASSSAVKWAVTQGTESDCGTALASGNFNGKTAGSTFPLLSNLEILDQDDCVSGNTISSNCKYTVWLWVDSNGSGLSNLSGKTIDVNIWSRIDMTSADSLAVGLYDENGNFTSWDNLVSNGDIEVVNNEITDSNDGLSGELVIPNSITSIGDYAFMSTSLTSVVIPNSVTSIATFAFSGTSLTSVVIPNSVTSIAYAAFADTPLTSVVISNSVTSIESTAFADTQLTSVIIPNSVTHIWESAFSGTPLTSVVLPNSLTYIGEGAFQNTNLTDVYYKGTKEEWDAIYISSAENAPLTSATIHYNYNG